ncbi:hypothetical protein DSM100238_1867 [Bifidobacterium apri]|uniref:Uncharacterized protein n=1 Tax=Bifidobacterium apri TaxID=1769423 RepID=A0A6A2W039_9BIFI|nr:hypothetical protein DSM100238_1867 [Bifidobacterium apri]
MNIITDIATLQDVWTSISTQWIGPLVFIIMGALSLKFLLNRQWSQFISFLGIGIMVAVIIYIAPTMFGQDSKLVNSVGTTVKQIN